MVWEFEPCVGLCADGSEPGACFRFCCLPLSLPPTPGLCSVSLSLSFSLSKIKHQHKFLKVFYYKRDGHSVQKAKGYPTQRT